jgi:ribonucleoside-triphosphate reductase
MPAACGYVDHLPSFSYTLFDMENIMRSLITIEKDLEAAREAFAHVEGTQAEVYSRIVGYYRSVRNWNKGKREEYGERKAFRLSDGESLESRRVRETAKWEVPSSPVLPAAKLALDKGAGRLLLFVRPACPACPRAKAAANGLGIPVDLVNADTEAGMAEAVRRRVFSTPTAILLAGDGQEVGRALNAGGIRALAAVAV